MHSKSCVSIKARTTYNLEQGINSYLGYIFVVPNIDWVKEIALWTITDTVPMLA
jgi:hypothetical protein